MMGLCRDCKHRTKVRAPHQDDARLKACDRWRVGYAVDPDDVADNEVLVEDDEGWAMMMGPDFGCVLFEAKT